MPHSLTWPAGAFGSKVLVGDVVIYSVLDICRDINADVLDKYPKTKAAFEKFAANETVAKYLGDKLPLYIKKD